MKLNRRKANRIRREMNVVASRLRNFDKHMKNEKEKLEKLYEKYRSELEKVT
jgi:hypothetical protein